MSLAGQESWQHGLRHESPVVAGHRRWDGPLCPERRADAAQAGARLAYDPQQVGWVPAQTEDDIAAPAGAVRPVVQLRPWRAEDRAAFRALLDDPEVWRTLPEPYPDPLTDDLADGLIALSNDAPHHMVRAVIHGGVPVGQVRLEFAGARATSPEAELSYWIGRAHWRKGLARAAIAQLLTETPPQPLKARVLPDNTASRRLLERAGFAPGGPDARDPRWLIYRRR
jgi:RimJ/RimL family protein N-acetyltransferase